MYKKAPWLDEEPGTGNSNLMAPFLSILSLCLFAAAAVATPLSSRHPKCHKPNVRKEWRSLGASGQKAYADAIKVGFAIIASE